MPITYFAALSSMAREKGSQRDVADHLTVRFLIVFAGKSTLEKSGKKYLTRISRKKKNKNRCAYDIVTFGTNIVKKSSEWKKVSLLYFQ